ncbi:MAG: glycosyltransferase family 2 protein [Chitinophagales bacterium]|nr:glycosyltransferase family 2 protein [Chitinophagales bacterium]
MIVSILVPCYNEQEVLEETIYRLLAVAREIDLDYEIIFIDDGSTDATLSIIEHSCATNKKIKCISLSRNFGHQPAISAGINHASGDVAIIIDADLQDPPELIPDMIKMWQLENCNVVYAVRRRRDKESAFKKLTARWYYRILSNLSDVSIPKDTGDFRLIDRKVIDTFLKLPEKQKYIRGLIAWVGFIQKPIFYERKERFAGITKFSVNNMLRFARVGLVYFTKKPLRLATNLGLFCFIVSIGLVVYVLISKFYFPETTVRGWSSIIIAIIFFGGVQLLSIGLMGEYIASIFDEIKSRPEYIMDRKINFDHEKLGAKDQP